MSSSAGNDLERGALEEKHNANGNSDYDELDEYTALQKYITTYRDPKAAEAEDAAHDDGADGKSRPWWAFWRSSGSSTAGAELVVPDEWLEADIHQGITNAEVENRRRRFGWNEITTEKTNLFLQFLSYFQGPVLYGKLVPCHMRTSSPRVPC